MAQSLFILLIILIFSSCSKKKKSNSDTNSILAEETDNPNVNRVIIDNLVKIGIDSPEKLEQKCTDEGIKLTQISHQLTFTEQKGCKFGEFPNLEPSDQRLQAIEIQTHSIAGPEDGVICNITISSLPDTQIRYDDYLFIILEDTVLIGSNSSIVSLLNSEDGIYKWDFSRMVGKSVTDINTDPYCIGGVTQCIVPPHEQSGPISISL